MSDGARSGEEAAIAIQRPETGSFAVSVCEREGESVDHRILNHAGSAISASDPDGVRGGNQAVLAFVAGLRW